MAEKLSQMAYPTNKFTVTKGLDDLAQMVVSDKNYRKSDVARKKMEASAGFVMKRHDDYLCRKLCKNCVNVCPNRANEVLTLADKEIIVHIDASCNECGNCVPACVQPCVPYKDNVTLFKNEEDVHDSENDGFAPSDRGYLIRWKGNVSECSDADLPVDLKDIVDAMKTQHPYYFL